MLSLRCTATAAACRPRCHRRQAACMHPSSHQILQAVRRCNKPPGTTRQAGIMHASSGTAAASGSTGPLTEVKLKYNTWTDPADPCKKYKAYWAGPQGRAAKGVVLFLHGFSQGPLAYAEMLNQVAGEDLLVLAPAPVPLISIFPKEVQDPVIESAKVFLALLTKDRLGKEFELTERALRNLGLLGHSMGAGLATKVASIAANQKQPFKAVMYMAPYIDGVADVDNKPAAALVDWPDKDFKDTVLSLQYGGADVLACVKSNIDPLKQALEDKRQKASGTKKLELHYYMFGTHVGFQDQLLFGNTEVDCALLAFFGAFSPLLTLAISAGLDPSPAQVRAVLELLLGTNMPTMAYEVRVSAATSGSTAGAGAAFRGRPKSASSAERGAASLRAATLLQLALQPITVSDVQLLADEKDGVATVTVQTPEESLRAYTELEWAAVIAFIPLTIILALVTVLLPSALVILGGVSLVLQCWVVKYQRSQARVEARKFFESNLC